MAKSKSIWTKYSTGFAWLSGFLGLLLALYQLAKIANLFPKEKKNPNPSNGEMNPNKLEKLKEAILSRVQANSTYNNVADVMFAQSLHETGKLTSSVFNELNNPFGMKTVEQRTTTQLDEGESFTDQNGIKRKVNHNQTYGAYANLEDAVDDLLIWLRGNGISDTDNVDLYVSDLKNKGYFTDTYENYRTAVKWFKDNVSI